MSAKSIADEIVREALLEAVEDAGFRIGLVGEIVPFAGRQF